MDPAELRRRRLVAQSIAGSGSTSVEGAARRMLATQAQDFHGSKWALALRSSARESDVDAALADGRIVRSWPMRGTLLTMARADSRWLTELLAGRSFAKSAGIWRAAGLVERDFETASAVARDVLSGGGSLSRAALLAEFDRAGVATSGGRGSHLIRRIAGEGTLVFAAPRGTEQRFALLDEWVPDAERLDRDVALGRLADRYIEGHGPATVHDLAWWSGLTVTDARRAVALADETVADVGGGLLVSARDPAALVDEVSPASLAVRSDVRLLPPFDEMLLGYGDRSASLAPEHFARVVPHANGLFGATVMLDGEVVGIWRRALEGTGDAAVVRVIVEPFVKLAKATVDSSRRRAAEYARYLGRTLEIEVAPPA